MKILSDFEKKRLERKVINDNAYLQGAINNLTAVLDTSRKEHEQVEIDESPLFKACKLIGEASGMKFVQPLQSEGEKASENALVRISRASHIRFRQIKLEESWWRMDNGSILAFNGEEKRPVALIPTSPGNYEIHDPSTGMVSKANSISISSLSSIGFVFYRPLPFGEIKLKDIVRYGLEGCWKRDILLLLMLGIAGGVFTMAIPIASSILFNRVIPLGESEYMWQLSILLTSGILAGGAFQLVRSIALLRLESKMDADIQASIWDRLLSLPVVFFREFSAGDLAMRATSITQIRRLLSGTVITAIFSSIFSFFNFGLLFFYDPGLASVAAAITAGTILVTSLLGYQRVRHQRSLISVNNKLASLVLQIIDGIAKLKVAGAEGRAFYLWSKEFGRQKKLSFRAQTVSNQVETLNSALPVLSTAIIFFFYVNLKDSIMSPGNFIAFNAAFISFFAAMLSLSNAAVTAVEIIPLYENAKPILSTLPEYDEEKLDPGELKGDIEVSHLNFRYGPEDPLVLKDVSLHIEKGEYVAVVGPSGSGKSTLLRILLGFERPEAGCIYYDGHELEKVDIRNVRRQTGVVLQNGRLMAGDIFTNIIGSNLGLTLEDAWEAARAAGIEEDIKQLPMGMFTVISEGASTISGGQRQRIMIARAIVNKPRIIFFDEATSALDNRTQSIVSESLDKLKATRIVIAHRLSTVINCDRIIVMDQGSIVESGTYNELLAKEGVFAKMAKRQLA